MNFNRGQEPKESMSIGRRRYSREAFPEYKYRAQVLITYIREEDQESIDTRMDIYTTETNKEKAEAELISRVKENVTWIQIVHWASKEQDELSAKLVEDFLNDFEYEKRTSD